MSVREITVQDVRTISETKQEQLGAIAMTGDGREWVYAKAGATALAPGLICVNTDETANHKNIAVAEAAAAGAIRVKVTLGATLAAADLYEDGWLTVNDAAGEGIAYRIAGHAAIASAGTGYIELDEPIKVALTTSSEVSLSSPFEAAVIAVTDQADFAIGVPNVTVTAEYYFWAQTKGVCSVLADEAAAKGAELTFGTSVAGSVEAVDAVAEHKVGTALNLLVDTEYQPIWLSIT